MNNIGANEMSCVPVCDAQAAQNNFRQRRNDKQSYTHTYARSARFSSDWVEFECLLFLLVSIFASFLLDKNKLSDKRITYYEFQYVCSAEHEKLI